MLSQKEEQSQYSITRRIITITEEKIENYNPTPDLRSRVERLENEIDELRKKYCLRILRNDLAEEEIKAYLIEMKRKGLTKISIVDIVDSLRLPIEQIEYIMSRLKSRGVKEID